MQTIASDSQKELKVTAVATIQPSPIWAIPALAGTIVVVAMWAFSRFAQIGPLVELHPQLQRIPDTLPIPGEFRARALWTTSALVFVLLVIWTCVISLLIIRGNTHGSTRSLFWKCTLGYLILLMGGAYLWNIAADQMISLEDAVKMETLLDITPIRRTLVYIGACGMALVTAAACALLCRDRRAENNTPQQLAQRLRHSQLLVYSQCASLAATVVTTYFKYAWPASFVVYSDQIWVKQVASTMAATEGTAYTVWTLFVFIPVLLIHSEWIAQTADAAQKSTVDLAQKAPADAAQKTVGWKREEWLNQFDLGGGSVSLFGRLAAMLGPTVVGLLPKLLA